MKSVIDSDSPAAMLGGLSPQQFMRRHWQKKPLVVRQAVPAASVGIEWAQVVELAARTDVESRIVRRVRGRWQLQPGPFGRADLPGPRVRSWTLLVQGVDLHLAAAHELMSRFRFLPDARLDDVMVSCATDGGGVGPHVDSYDVFLLQVQGRRRWRIGRVAQPRLVPDLPLKILAGFEAEEEHLLDAGDMLYLPPGWGHDGVAEGPCMTASIGFRAASRDEFAREVLQRRIDAAIDAAEDDADRGQGSAQLYSDRGQLATAEPARIPDGDAGLRLRCGQPAGRRSARAGRLARGMAERAEAAGLVRYASTNGCGLRCRPRQPHPHAVGPLAHLHQR